MRSSTLDRPRRKRGTGKYSKAPLTGNIGRIPSLPEALAENRQPIVPSGGNPEMSVRFRPGPLDTRVCYLNGKPVEILYAPKAKQVNVLFVRDLETRMCFVVEAYKVVHKPEGK